jgi:hypothetical protein
MKKIIIELTKREENWAANTKDKPDNHSFGRSSAEALGQLLLSNQSFFESFSIYIKKED